MTIYSHEIDHKVLMDDFNLLNVNITRGFAYREAINGLQKALYINIKVRRYLILTPIFDNKSFAKCEWEHVKFAHGDITND